MFCRLTRGQRLSLCHIPFLILLGTCAESYEKCTETCHKRNRMLLPHLAKGLRQNTRSSTSSSRITFIDCLTFFEGSRSSSISFVLSVIVHSSLFSLMFVHRVKEIVSLRIVFKLAFQGELIERLRRVSIRFLNSGALRSQQNVSAAELSIHYVVLHHFISRIPFGT